jgi:hypothetical protein
MKDLFNDILNIDQVEGALLIANDGTLVYNEFRKAFRVDSVKLDLPGLMDVLKDIREADILFREKRLYIRKAGIGSLIIIMGLAASSAMIRLNCDLILPLLKDYKHRKMPGAVSEKMRKYR